MKYSLIVPVYNTEKYLDKCLKSIEEQSFKNYEVIIINDGSTDNSQIIIDKYVKNNPKHFFSYIQENKGLSEARNIAIKKATGDYMIFIDSDDYIDTNLLEVVNNRIEKGIEIDLIRIANKIVDLKVNEERQRVVDREFSEKTGEEAFIMMRKSRITIEAPWAYVIRRDYWKNNKFEFARGMLHEDWGLMPLVLIKAKKVSAINKEAFYYHVIREGSIVTTVDYKSLVRKAFDVLPQYDFLVKEINKIEIKNKKSKKMFLAYITDGVIGKSYELKGKEYEKYYSELMKRKVLKNEKVYSLKSLFKKILHIYCLKLGRRSMKK